MEYFDVLDESGNPTGAKKSKDEVHRDGDWHGGIHVWIINQQKELLLQRRSHAKRSWPGAWDVSVGGHLSAGENSKDAAVREIKEELGLSVRPDDLQYLFTTQDEIFDGTHRERGVHHVYLLKTDVPMETFRIRPKEVAEVKFVSLREVESMVRAKDPEMVPHWEEYLETIKAISSHDEN